MLARKARAATLHAAILAVLAVPPLVAQPAPATTKPEDLCSIEGKVLNFATGAPVGRATVVIARVQTNPTAPAAGHSVTTDAEGRFVAAGIPAGAYRLMAVRDGFMIADYGAEAPRGMPSNSSGYPSPAGPPLNLAPGQKRPDIEFRLSPYGTITGRVVGSDGEPMAGVSVGTLTPGYSHGKRVLNPVASSARTNDLGEYRIFQVPPGRYYLCAVPGNVAMGEDRSAKPRQENDAPTYYPGTTDALAAAPLVVAPGATTPGINFKMVRMRLGRISGRIVTQPGVAGSATQFALESAVSRVSSRSGIVGSQGQFELRGIMPGSYTFSAIAQTGTTLQSFYEAAQAIEVGAEPIENLAIQMTRGIEIQGNVRTEKGENLDLRRGTIILRLRAYGHSPQSAVPDADGNFKLSAVFPGLYDLVIPTAMPPGYYLKSARWGDQDVLEGGLDASRVGGDVLQLVVGTGAATVTGAVTDDKGAPVSGATVLLAPQEPGRRVQDQMYWHPRTDTAGRFNVANVPPGEYRLYAWQELPSGAWLSPEFMLPVEAKGVALSAHEGGSHTVDLKVLPREE